jgi:hypothetical protein
MSSIAFRQLVKLYHRCAHLLQGVELEVFGLIWRALQPGRNRLDHLFMYKQDRLYNYVVDYYLLR